MESILLIEDEKDLRETVEATFKEEGYDVISTEKSADGLEAVKVKKPDLILLDIMTGSLHGVEFLKQLRALPAELNDSKVIVFTNLDNDITKEQMSMYDVSDYIVKAHSGIDEIVEKTKKVLAQ